MEYNFLNLPSKIWVSEDDYMSYTWYYDGTKVSVEGYEGSYGADYIGSFVYNNDDDRFIRDIRFGNGIVRETASGRYETLYWVTDHLGSPRVAFTLDDSEYGVYVAERNDYYPFGGRWDDGSGHGGTIAAGNNRYALSGKERQTMSRMGSYLAAHESLLDFGARFYDPATAIFLQQDPLAEKYYNISPYAYCANNPVNFVDPDGRAFTLLARVAIGATIGAAVSGTAAVINGKSFTEVVAAAAGGAVDGGLTTIGAPFLSKFINCSTVKGLIVGASSGTLGSLVEQGINIAFGNQENVDLLDVGVSAATGTVVNGGSEFLGNQGKSIIKDAINSESTVKTLWKEAKASIKNSGKKPTPAKVKNMVEENKKLMEETATKTLEISIEAVGYSFGFYNEIYEDAK